jgi:hypothetical protein
VAFDKSVPIVCGPIRAGLDPFFFENVPNGLPAYLFGSFPVSGG